MSSTFVLIFSTSVASDSVGYLTVDTETDELLPKLSYLQGCECIKDLTGYRACVLNNHVFVTGGKKSSSGEIVNTVFRYNIINNNWTEMAPMTKARHRHTASVLDSKIFVSGGLVGESELTDSCESYEPVLDDWQREDRLPFPCVDHCAVELDNVLYVAGGTCDFHGFLDSNNSIWVLEKTEVRASSKKKKKCSVHIWKKLVSWKGEMVRLWNSLTRLSVCSFESKIYYFGGVFMGTSQARQVEVTNEADSLTALQPTVGLKGKDSPVTSDKIEILHISNNTNEEKRETEKGKKTMEFKRALSRRFEYLREPRCSCGVVQIRSQVYIIGGYQIEDVCDNESNEFASINTIEKFNPRTGKSKTAFNLGKGDFRQVDCCLISIPAKNKAFKPAKYQNCKWVLW